PFVLDQVHGADVVPASSSPGHERADGAWWSDRRDPGAVPAVRTADCVGFILADRRGGAGAAVHAGWRGIAAGIPDRAVESLTAQGTPPAELVAALGPAIGPCCYEVGDEVTAAIASVTPGGAAPGRAGAKGRFFLDLHAAVARRLERAGVPADRIHPAPWCTRCRADWFFSYRRDGASAGRLMTVVGARRAVGGRP
ncbi:MAG: polyphenol oxidase family protein, partial [Acidobacteriota bacterium]|nr:polyphenol oxidase family protein [Acidobacteriota bacterium]